MTVETIIGSRPKKMCGTKCCEGTRSPPEWIGRLGEVSDTVNMRQRHRMLFVEQCRDTPRDPRAAARECRRRRGAGYHLVTVKTPVRSAKTGSRTSPDQTM